VVLRGISFHGASVGNNAIEVAQVGSLYVEHCSIAEFTGDGVRITAGGNLFMTGTDVRKCLNGIVLEPLGATAANLVVHDSRFTECDNGVNVLSVGAAVTGLLTNCTASLCSLGFVATSQSTGSVDLTLTNCRAFFNGAGVVAQTFVGGASANTTVRMANCVVTANGDGTTTLSRGGPASILGTSPGSNLISGNSRFESTSSSVTLH
jgi:hypothetical protein